MQIQSRNPSRLISWLVLCLLSVLPLAPTNASRLHPAQGIQPRRGSVPTRPFPVFFSEKVSDPRPRVTRCTGQGKRINSKPNKYQPCVVACPYTS